VWLVRHLQYDMSPHMLRQTCAALAIGLYRAMEMTFWLPQVEAVLGREAGQQEQYKQDEVHCTGPKSRYEDSPVRQACYTRKPLLRIGEYHIAKGIGNAAGDRICW